MVAADINVLATVLKNFISNATKFCEEGNAIFVEASIEPEQCFLVYLCSLLSALCSLLSALCSLLDAPLLFQVSVRNRGVRLSPADCARLFKPFEQISNTNR
jgi:signal transduction histidine kinase